jgi:hypothetical protein
MARATFVIATYRRVEALRSTVRSLLCQTDGDWTAVVVGDGCGDETAGALRAFRDPRIRYYNLPERFGEQSGPNSAGLHLATGDFVAFLNHDDLLLQDHLEHVTERLADADFCFGIFANATRLESGAPVFTSAGPRERDLAVMLRRDPWLFDPSSFWMIRLPYARRVGPWRPAREVWRTSLRDWLLRAWRLGGGFRFGTRITGLRFLTRSQPDGPPAYAVTTPEHEVMAARLERESPESIRSAVRAQLRDAADGPMRPDGRDLSPWRLAAGWCRRRVLASLYFGLGFDPESVLGPLAGRRKGALLEKLVRKRTGEPLPAAATLDAFLRDPGQYRVL